MWHEKRVVELFDLTTKLQSPSPSPSFLRRSLVEDVSRPYSEDFFLSFPISFDPRLDSSRWDPSQIVLCEKVFFLLMMAVLTMVIFLLVPMCMEESETDDQQIDDMATAATEATTEDDTGNLGKMQNI